jgi:glutamate racemase
MIIMDSGLGGISVVRALRALAPDRAVHYIADTAGFPYGKRSAGEIQARAVALVHAAQRLAPDMPIVLACNTLSTLCLAPLRAQFSTTFVGTVPAVKTAAQQSRSRRFTLLATPNTAQSQYTQGLISEFASDCVVDVYGAPNLALYAERLFLGEAVEDAVLRAELAPAFCNDALGKTDALVLGCTHYPLIADSMHRVSPWPVLFVDSSEAIARRALSMDAATLPESAGRAYVTRYNDVALYRALFLREGFAAVDALTLDV